MNEGAKDEKENWIDITSSLQENQFEAGVRSVDLPNWECRECGYRYMTKREPAERICGVRYIKHFILPQHAENCSHYGRKNN